MVSGVPKAAIWVQDHEWSETGGYLNQEDPRCRLLTSIHINGTALHLEAYAVKNQAHLFAVVDDEADTALGLLAGDCGFPLCTTTIAGREYVLVAFPHAD